MEADFVPVFTCINSFYQSSSGTVCLQIWTPYLCLFSLWSVSPNYNGTGQFVRVLLRVFCKGLMLANLMSQASLLGDFFPLRFSHWEALSGDWRTDTKPWVLLLVSFIHCQVPSRVSLPSPSQHLQSLHTPPGGFIPQLPICSYGPVHVG